MIAENKPTTESEQPLGVIACLTRGFEIAANHPQLTTLPFLLDLFLWLGPRLSLKPLLDKVSVLWATPPTPELASAYQTLNQIIDELGQQYNLFALLEPAPLLGVPTLMSKHLTILRPFGERPILPVASAGQALGWTFFLTVLGLGLAAIYFWQIGKYVGEETERLPVKSNTPLNVWGSLLKLTFWLLFFLTGIGSPVLLASSLLSLISFGVASFLITLVLSAVAFLLLHCIYTIPSMVQFRQTPFQALRESLILTRADFPGTLGILLALLIISQGLNYVWTLPAPESWPTVVGVGGHAIVSTALIISLFIFYQERIIYLEILKKAYAASTTKSPAETQ